MLVYISGSISGDPEYREKFAKAERELICKDGYYVLNPAKLAEDFQMLDETTYMSLALELLKAADAIYMLSDWVTSEGAYIEFHLAQKLGKEIMFEWERYKDFYGTRKTG